MIFISSLFWIELVPKAVIGREVGTDAGNKSEKKAVDKFLATPGEFPYAVVVFDGTGEMFAGILVTDDTILTTCKILMDIIPEHKSRAMLHSTQITAVGSNGDWMKDPNRQNERTDFIFLGENCLKITDQYYIELGVAVLQKPFYKTPYVNAIANRASMKNAKQWKDVILKIIDHANCYKKIEEKCKRRDFVIAGYICPEGKCSKDSPMFRMITHILEDDECLKLICANISCKDFTKKTLESSGTLCFPTEGIGGPGSPVAFNRVVVAVGNFVKGDHLIATRFDIGYELIDDLYSTAQRITCMLSLLAGMCSLIVGNTIKDEIC